MSIPPPYVLGIDSALSHTGIGVIELLDGQCRGHTEVIVTPVNNAAASISARYQRIRYIAQRFVFTIRRLGRWPLLALIEAAALDAHGGNPQDRDGLWWYLAGPLIDAGVPVAQVAPTCLKRWAVGHGGSKLRPVDKAHMVAAMRDMWPGLPATGSDARHHECEALAMAHMCAQHLGWPVPIRSHHGDPLSVVKWPIGK